MTPEKSKKTHVKLFLIAAVYNFLGAIVPIVDPKGHFEVFFKGTVTESPALMMINQAFWVTVLFFGIGYYMISRDPVRNRGIIWLGAMGKLYVFGLWTWHYLTDLTAPFALVGATGDLIFACLFLLYLRKNPVVDK